MGLGDCERKKKWEEEMGLRDCKRKKKWVAEMRGERMSFFKHYNNALGSYSATQCIG
jgi:hypothetical protein